MTPCRSKVAFVLALDPLQKQGLDHHLFFDSLQKQSHSYLNLLILTPCRVTFVLALDPLQKQGLGYHLFFRLPVEAKSQLFKFVNVDPLQKQGHICSWHLIPLQKQGLGHSLFFDSLQKQSQSHLNLLMLTPCRSKVTFVFGTWSPAEARSWPFFIFRLPARAKSQPLLGILCRSKISAFLFSTSWGPNKISVSVFT